MSRATARTARVERTLRSVLGPWYGRPAVYAALAVATLLHSCLLLFASPYGTAVGPFALAAGGMCLFAAAVACMAWSDRWAPCAVTAMWSACALLNGFDGRMPLPMSVLAVAAVCAATFRLTGRHPVLGVLLIAPPVYACLVMTAAGAASGGVPRFVLLCVGELASAIAAVALRRNRRLAELRRRERRRALRDRIERTLHDSTANTIVYALSLVGTMRKRDGDGTDARCDATLDDLDAALRRSLAQVRDVIDLIETSESDRGPYVSPPASAGAAADLGDRLRAAAERMREHLRRVGFDVELLFDDADRGGGTVPGERADLVEGLLHELEGNVIKHADPHGPVMMSIAVHADGVAVSLADDAAVLPPSPDASSGERAPVSGGTGLARYGRLIEAAGGTFAVRDENGVWSLNATVPFMP
ncbi:histidine kinase [Bifidobacterium sp. DSM 109958]|uniref:histidine kinase n=1 Tax=Bifidobacterium moraviense TaxID=2675323 RepID=A0A7Y0F3F5_9BIFI|nr:histidine kinase [Bifidobacterium sp. DSM 109958]NMN01174.1 histidine kinase [Bifidobacterium sp. DSM 109958]